MKSTDRKAVALVVDGRVDVISATFNDDGELVTATGTVKGYTTTITPDGVECDCEFGQHSTKTHSHDVALRLAAQLAQENQ